MTTKHPYLDWLAPRLDKLGITILSLDTGGSHGKLRLSHMGRVRFVTIPLTPSDQRGVRNCLQNIRREFDLGGGRKPVAGTPKPRKARALKLVPPPLPVTEGADPWAALKPLQVIDPTTDPVPQWLARSLAPTPDLLNGGGGHAQTPAYQHTEVGFRSDVGFYTRKGDGPIVSDAHADKKKPARRGDG